MNQILAYTNHILDGPTSVFMKMIELVPDDKIQFKPYDSSMSVAELVCHILSVMQIHALAVSDGERREEHARKSNKECVFEQAS
ncbi:MAG: hypothetical protein RTV72_10805 [Candidatus Thorarchaeota archaeon]